MPPTFLADRPGGFLTEYLPPRATDWAGQVDWILWLITAVSLVCTVLITGAMLYFAVKYKRRTDNDPTPSITHNAALETLWTVIPTIVVIFIFYYGYAIYHDMRTPPANAIEVSVEGRKWSWSFEHDNGKKDIKTLVVPEGRPVRLIMRSKDILHSFFLPAMRVKEDVIPGTYSYLWFTPTKTGEFPIFCAEYCGDGHSSMLGTLKVVSQQAYQDYLIDRSGDGPQLSPAEAGAQVYQKAGCMTCHSIDGTRLVGPSLKGVFGHEVPLHGGGKVNADENYLRESIENPQAKVVEGFGPVSPMQPYKGVISDKEIDQLVAYIKSLG